MELARANRTFRVFVSSTFSDFKAERNALQTRVFPRLHRYCLQHGARFQAIDLRWGVSEEAARDQQTINICLNEIERCRRPPLPNFVVLLGDRYGWCPPPPQIPEAEWDDIMIALGEDSTDARLLKDWYRLDRNAVPPERFLRPRAGAYLAHEQWEPVEGDLREVLERAAVQIRGIDPAAILKYQASATHQEIECGAFRVPEEHAFCYLRTIKIDGRRAEQLPEDYFKERPHPAARDYFNLDREVAWDPRARERLRRLKKELRALRGIHFRDGYQATWTWATGNDEPPISLDHVDRLCEDIYSDLLRVIDRQMREFVQGDRLTREVEAHRDFAKERAAVFEGRDEELATIRGYLRQPDSRPLIVAGEAGSGKSALMAEAALGADGPDPHSAIVRFVGVTPDSTSGRALLGDVFRQLAQEWGPKEAGRAVPTEFRDLAAQFPERLRQAAERRPVALFIDALDQVSAADGARHLSWLPLTLPANVALVLSTTPGDTLTTLEARIGDQARFVSVGPLRRAEGERALRKWLAHATPPRTLQNRQMKAVLDAFAVEGRPLHLRLAFEEARRWKSDAVGIAVALPTTIPEILEETLFKRLSRREHHGPVLVPHALGYLAAAKNGVTEDEMLEVLSRSDAVFDDFLRYSHPDQRLPERRLPVVIWSRLFFDLEPYLTERAADGISLMTFYHRQLEEAVQRMYLGGREGVERHRELAGYFFDQGLEIEGEQAAPNLRTLSELPFQQTKGGMWDAVFQTLTNFEFLEKKAVHASVVESTDADGNPAKTHTGVYELREDFALALRKMPGGDAGRQPRIVVTASGFGDRLTIRCPHCKKSVAFRPEWRGTEQECPPEEGGCGGPWRVNEFVLLRRTRPLVPRL